MKLHIDQIIETIMAHDSTSALLYLVEERGLDISIDLTILIKADRAKLFEYTISRAYDAITIQKNAQRWIEETIETQSMNILTYIVETIGVLPILDLSLLIRDNKSIIFFYLVEKRFNEEQEREMIPHWIEEALNAESMDIFWTLVRDLPTFGKSRIPLLELLEILFRLGREDLIVEIDKRAIYYSFSDPFFMRRTLIQTIQYFDPTHSNRQLQEKIASIYREIREKDEKRATGSW